MKEVVLSAAAVVGLFGFAALYNSNTQNRARRDIFEVEIDDFANEDPFGQDKYGFHSSLDNMTTDSWKTLFEEAGIPDSDFADLEEDVQNKNRAFARVNFNKLNDMILSFNREGMRRKQVNANFLEARGSLMGRDNPNVLDSQADNGQADGDQINYYNGVANTHPKIERLLEENGWSDAMVGLDGESVTQTQIWFMFPAAVPLWYPTGDEARDSFHAYWRFVMRFKNHLPMNRSVRISIGLWAKGAVFTPRGSKLHARLPWTRIERYYKRPRATASQPYIMNTVDTLLGLTKQYGVSSSNTGSNCIVFWFHHDYANDLSKVAAPSGYEKVRQLNQQCTVLHTFSGLGGTSAQNLDYLNMMVPSLSGRVAIDNDYNGGFFYDKIEDLDSDDAVRRYFQYLRLVTNRQMCRCFRAAWSPPPTQPDITIVPNTEGPGWEATDAPEVNAPSYGGDDNYEFSGTAAPTYDTYASDTTEGATMRGIEDETTPKIPEVDSCCGFGPAGTPYDSELRVCCEDGTTKQHEEYDPCTMGSINGFY